MMRRARRAKVLIALSLLTSAAMAHAECAWVLWEQNRTTNFWLPASGWETHAQCDQDRDRRAFTPPGSLNVRVERSDVRFTCLPDTVDPRGPKGK